MVERVDRYYSEDEWQEEFVLTGVPAKIANEMQRLAECEKIIWIKTADMIVGIVENEGAKRQTYQRRNRHPIDWSGHKRRVTSGSYESMRWKAIRHHRNLDWETTTHRSVNDVSKMMRPSLKRYEWALIEKDATCPDYEKKTHAQESGYLIQEELLDPLHIS